MLKCLALNPLTPHTIFVRLKSATETLVYLALSALIFSSQGIAPQNGARMMLELSRQRQNSWKSEHIAVLFSSSLCALHADGT